MDDFKLRTTEKKVKAGMMGGGVPLDNVYRTCGGWLLRNSNGIQRVNDKDWIVNVDGHVFLLPSPIFNMLFVKDVNNGIK